MLRLWELGVVVEDKAQRKPDLSVKPTPTRGWRFVEVTVRARAGAADVREKRAKYSDLPGDVVVLCVDAVTGAAVGDAYGALEAAGLARPEHRDALEHAVADCVARWAAEPLLPPPKKRSRRPPPGPGRTATRRGRTPKKSELRRERRPLPKAARNLFK